jgi:hypothetical protein
MKNIEFAVLSFRRKNGTAAWILSQGKKAGSNDPSKSQFGGTVPYISINQEQNVSGIHEIIVVLVILLILFYLPKRAAGNRVEKSQAYLVHLSGKMRLAIFVSSIWLAVMAYFFPPWQEKLSAFIYLGAGPVALAWGIIWVVTGYRNR